MSNYEIQGDGFKFTVGMKATTATVRYRYTDTGTIADLPEPGDSFTHPRTSVAWANVICMDVSEGWDAGSSAKPYWDCKYTSDLGGGGGTSVPQAPSSRRFSLAGEKTTLSKPAGGWIWDSDDAAVEQPISKKIVTGSFSRSITGMSDAENTTFLGLVKTQAGTINSVAFEGFNIGQVLFEGIDGGTYTDEDGSVKHGYELTFSYRIIKDDYTALTQDDWLYVLREDTAAWDKPKEGTNFLYKKTAFASLFA